MALQNGVLVHGPTAWACAIRLPDGEVRVASERKRFRAADVERPLLRGPARVAEAFALLPAVKRRLPGARFAFEQPKVLATMTLSAAVASSLRGSPRLGPVARELLGSLLARAPASAALGGSERAAYHGAEHVSIGSYEHGEPRDREHERCGSHLLAPLLTTAAIGNALAARVPVHLRGAARASAAVGAVAASTELLGWMIRNPDRRLARALSRPGHELQHRFATATPSPAQLEVAEAALNACLRLEDGHSSSQ